MANSIPSNPVQQLRLNIKRGNWLWALPVIEELERRAPGKAMEWATAILELHLPRFATEENRKLREQWVANVSKLGGAASADVAQQSRAIWHHAGMRDQWQTAASRLYEALAAFLNGDEIPYRRTIAMAVEVLACDSRGQLDADRVCELIEQYNRME